MLYRFKPNEIIRNTIKCYPKINFKTRSDIIPSNIVYNNQQHIPQTEAETGEIDLYDFAGMLSNDCYLISTKTSNCFIENDVPLSEYTSSSYGTEFRQYYPVTFNIQSDRTAPSERAEKVRSINQIAKLYYNHMNNQASCDLSNITKTIIDIPRMFYGSSIKRGSIVCKIYDSSASLLIAEARDIAKNGLLYQLAAAEDSPSGSVVGFVLYDHGIMAMTSSLKLSGSCNYCNLVGEEEISDYPRWNWFFHTGVVVLNDTDLQMELSFEGVSYLNTMTMFAHAPQSQLNHSNNLTYLKRAEGLYTFTGSKSFIENPQREIKNIVYNVTNQTSSFEKETYINKIGIYDEEKKLIAVTSLANPIRKRQNDGYTFKIKKDLL